MSGIVWGVGISITDSCVSFETTLTMLNELNEVSPILPTSGSPRLVLTLTNALKGRRSKARSCYERLRLISTCLSCLSPFFDICIGKPACPDSACIPSIITHLDICIIAHWTRCKQCSDVAENPLYAGHCMARIDAPAGPPRRRQGGPDCSTL